ncbi:amidohydrolase [Virgibacillus halodenitrificans]|uniref:amidohydrolase n=1 Tax=Virgibacillus halodenitrificans TaxID=1482 RepID=UPI000761A04F
MSEKTTLFINGHILTMDEKNRIAGSVLVENKRIIQVWDEFDPRNTINLDKDSKIIDLNKKTLLPGFIDTHNHILMYGLLRKQVDCSSPSNNSISDILSRIKAKASEMKESEWILGYGYDDTLLIDNRHPTKEDLDLVAPKNPVFITHISGHLAVANSLALRYAGISNSTPQPDAGHFGKDEQDKLNGVLYEPGAMGPVQQLIPEYTLEDMVAALENASQEYLAQGITTNTDAAVTNIQQLEAHLIAAKTRKNPMRTQLMIMHNLLRKNEIYGDYSPSQLNLEIQQRSGNLAKLDSAKMFQDGSIQGLTGALREPYHQESHTYGELIHKQRDFQEEVLDLHQRGFRITTHGNGDRAIGSILDAYGYALEKVPKSGHNHRIEHVQTATTEDIQRMKEMNVAGSFFINHVYYWGDRHEKIFLGPKRARRISPLAEAKDHELLFTLHSDCPVTPISPLFSVWAAVNRKTREGKILGPEQRIDVITALKAMTIYGAKLIFDEENTGSIEVGKKADFVVLDKDPLIIDPQYIKDIQVESTFIDGEIVYNKEESVR